LEVRIESQENNKVVLTSQKSKSSEILTFSKREIDEFMKESPSQLKETLKKAKPFTTTHIYTPDEGSFTSSQWGRMKLADRKRWVIARFGNE
jgi:hypothetical protein